MAKDPAPPARRPERTRPRRRYAVHVVDARISPLGDRRETRLDIPRFQPLPSPQRPFATFLGRMAHERRAAFAVLPGTSVLGGDCLPSRGTCTLVTLRAGEHAWIGLPDGAAWRLDVPAIRQRRVASRAAARAARRRHSAEGACALQALGIPLATVSAAAGVPLGATASARPCPSQ